MKAVFYIFLIRLSRVFGSWVFVLISRLIAACYYILFPNKAAVSVRFYRTVFPGHCLIYYLICAWKQYKNFTYVFLDRFLVRDLNDITYTSEGHQHLETAVGRTGGILLMSHLGNWDVAANLLKKKYDRLKILLYMGIRNKEQIEAIQKEDLAEKGVEIVAVDQEGGSPFDIIKGIEFIRSGGLVSMTGDVLWRKGQRSVSVKILGHEALLPDVPYLFAHLSGAPLFIFFAFRTGDKSYHFNISEPIQINCPSRAKRDEIIRKSAQKYADILEQTILMHPFEWYHFEPFLIPRNPDR
ncbi:Lauroyl/myristoyl acyltransferase [uncultured Desulfobacterium sp.]|uniref:Lauroyl/myristoyl acyltransferase n=1 Tax=uncultured Desulfobacterium sp. TaxID=201089 RepID=A0A445N361_9BACT|nr:Lauroyl/myristoyl acyltransferase [uncultured Desulfobacterium sp.]